jgi:hypothetical protein
MKFLQCTFGVAASCAVLLSAAAALLAPSTTAPLEVFKDFISGDSRGFHFPLEARSSFFESFTVRFGPLSAGRNVITDNVAVAGYRDGLVRF